MTMTHADVQSWLDRYVDAFALRLSRGVFGGLRYQFGDLDRGGFVAGRVVLQPRQVDDLLHG